MGARSMSRFLVTKHLGKLAPVDDIGAQYLSKIKQGDTFEVEIKRLRNGKHHRLFWKLCSVVADNSDRYGDAEQVAMAFKIATGHVVPFIHPLTGQTYWTPKSIAFDKMDQTEFSVFFDKCIAIVASRFLPGVTDAELRAELESMCQGRAA
jgi:hypothetical protein